MSTNNSSDNKLKDILLKSEYEAQFFEFASYNLVDNSKCFYFIVFLSYFLFISTLSIAIRIRNLIINYPRNVLVKELIFSYIKQTMQQMEAHLMKECKNSDECKKINSLIQNLREKYELSTEVFFKQTEVK